MPRRRFEDLLDRRRAISPIIATLILILIAIASGVILYAYVGGFIGNSTQNTGVAISTISVDNACVSVTPTHCNGSQYSITVRNLGTNTISNSGSPKAQIYLNDITSTASGSTTCTISSQITSGSSITCSGSLSGIISVNSGDSLSVKVVMPDGGSAVSTTRVLP